MVLEVDKINSNVPFSHFDLEIIWKSIDKLEEFNKISFFTRLFGNIIIKSMRKI